MKKKYQAKQQRALAARADPFAHEAAMSGQGPCGSASARSLAESQEEVARRLAGKRARAPATGPRRKTPSVQGRVIPHRRRAISQRFRRWRRAGIPLRLRPGTGITNLGRRATWPSFITGNGILRSASDSMSSTTSTGASSSTSTNSTPPCTTMSGKKWARSSSRWWTTPSPTSPSRKS